MSESVFLGVTVVKKPSPQERKLKEIFVVDLIEKLGWEQGKTAQSLS